MKRYVTGIVNKDAHGAFLPVLITSCQLVFKSSEENRRQAGKLAHAAEKG